MRLCDPREALSSWARCINTSLILAFSAIVGPVVCHEAFLEIVVTKEWFFARRLVGKAGYARSSQVTIAVVPKSRGLLVFRAAGRSYRVRRGSLGYDALIHLYDEASREQAGTPPSNE